MTGELGQAAPSPRAAWMESSPVDLRGVRRRALAAALGVTEATVKQHVHSLLLKTTYDTLADLVADVLREAWGVAEVTEL